MECLSLSASFTEYGITSLLFIMICTKLLVAFLLYYLLYYVLFALSIFEVFHKWINIRSLIFICINQADSLTLSTSSSTVNVLDVSTVPLVVKHRIAGFLLLAKARATFALSATLATCSGSKVALEAGGQSLASAPLARPSSSFRTATTMETFDHCYTADVYINSYLLYFFPFFIKVSVYIAQYMYKHFGNSLYIKIIKLYRQKKFVGIDICINNNKKKIAI